ncbi:MAG: hypothetical protein KAH18_05945 [Psychromonas sp.]|nr:hypothetical protein [Psychromonas sp.]
MVTDEELKLMYTRKHAAQSALRFFTDIVNVKSTNACCPCEYTNAEEEALLGRERDKVPNATAEQMMKYSTLVGYGNCSEKAAICFCSLSCNPLLSGNSVATLARMPHQDHLFIIVSDFEMVVGQEIDIRNLCRTTMVVDGWTEDWYFPNLGWYTTLSNALTPFPSLNQLAGRAQISILKVCKSKVTLS